MFPKRKPYKFIVTLIALWLVGFAGFCSLTMTMLPQERTQASDAIVVLTGGKFRLKTGFDLLAQNYAPHLFITGVHPDVRLEELTYEWEQNNKTVSVLPDCCITLGHQAISTRQNAEETKGWAVQENVSSIRLVTSRYHMPRAMLEFRHAMPGIRLIAHPVTDKDYGPGDPKFWSLSFSEYNKLIFRFISTGLSSVLPSSKSS